MQSYKINRMIKKVYNEGIRFFREGLYAFFCSYEKEAGRYLQAADIEGLVERNEDKDGIISIF